MAKIDAWLANQLPDMQRSMEVVNDVDFLHISTDQALKKMRPRIGFRQMKAEDRTIPRICGAPNIVGCIYGHAGIHTYTMDYFVNGYSADKWNGLIAVYRMNVKQAIKPGKKLVPDAKATGEVWIVPYAPETYEVYPTRIGSMLLHHIGESVLDGTPVMSNVFYLKVDTAFRLEQSYLTPGFYQFSLAGDLSIKPGASMLPVEGLTTLSSAEWNSALSKLRAAAKNVWNK